jgi:hypothetical protein
MYIISKKKKTKKKKKKEAFDVNARGVSFHRPTNKMQNVSDDNSSRQQFYR